MLLFSFVSKCFLISSLISSVTRWLFSSILLTLHMFVLFTVFFLVFISNLIYGIVIRKDACYDFSFLKFTEIHFVAQHVLCPAECFMCTLKGCVFCCFQMECSVNIS